MKDRKKRKRRKKREKLENKKQKKKTIWKNVNEMEKQKGKKKV